MLTLRTTFLLMLISSITQANPVIKLALSVSSMDQHWSNADTIPFENVELRINENHWYALHYYENQPFSGFALENQEALDGTWQFIRQFDKGKLIRFDAYGSDGYHHRFVEYFPDGTSHCIMYHRNGNQYLEQFYDQNENPIGIWKRWKENGDLEWEINKSKQK